MIIDVERKSLIEFVGDIVRKVGDSSLLAVEATKTARAGEIGTESGLFYTPRVLDLDLDKGVLVLERLSGLVTLLRLAIDRDARLLELSARAGRALAVVHEQLILPDKVKHQLPAEWMAPETNPPITSSDKNVFIHGDFASVNVCLHEPSGRLVILDWSAAPIVGRTPTFGSRYFDILWFVACVFRGAPGLRFLDWNAESIADVFLRGYANRSSQDINDAIGDYFPKIYRLQRKKVWFLAGRKLPLRASAYICAQVFLYARFQRFLRNYLAPPSLLR
jgi:tRNA A-37 threonylcarbamoyl transferase component Bud32